MESLQSESEPNFSVICEDNAEPSVHNRQTRVRFAETNDEGSAVRRFLKKHFPNVLKLIRPSNSIHKTYIFLISCFVLFSVIGLVRFGLSVATLVAVWRASVLILFNLYMIGVSQMFSGAILVFVCVMAFRSLAAKKEDTMTSTGAKGIIVALLFLMTLDIMVVFLSSRYLNDDFYSDVVLGMNDSLIMRYKGDRTSYTTEWDNLQTQTKCCGAENYTDWFASSWAKGIRGAGRNYSYGILPTSCRYTSSTSLTPLCNAIMGSAAENPTPTFYLSLANFTLVNICDLSLVAEGKDYIHPQPCATYYYNVIYYELRSVMITNLVFFVIELLLIYPMFKSSNKLPNNHQVCVANRNLPVSIEQSNATDQTT